MEDVNAKFKHAYRIPPIDIQSDKKITPEEAKRVLNTMPIEPKNQAICKTYFACGLRMVPVYMCKVIDDNTVYAFSDKEIAEWKNAEIIEEDL